MIKVYSFLLETKVKYINKKKGEKIMTLIEFIWAKYCSLNCEMNELCKSKKSLCNRTNAMLKAYEWRDKNPNGTESNLKGFITQNYCNCCDNNCVFFDLPRSCKTVDAIIKMIKWKDEGTI